MTKQQILQKKAFLVKSGKISRFIRKGKCLQCGWCCSHENCEHFIPATENEKAICRIHDQERPFKCTDFPMFPPIKHEQCGFRFFDILNNKILDVNEA